MSMSGESEYEPEGAEESLGEDSESPLDASMPADFDAESEASYQPEEPDVAEPMMGMAALHRQTLQQNDLYYNPVMDSPEVGEAEREELNPASDPYAESMDLGASTDYDSEYRNRSMFKDEMIQTLQSKARARALATAKFQDLAFKKKQ